MSHDLTQQPPGTATQRTHMGLAFEYCHDADEPWIDGFATYEQYWIDSIVPFVLNFTGPGIDVLSLLRAGKRTILTLPNGRPLHMIEVDILRPRMTNMTDDDTIVGMFYGMSLAWKKNARALELAIQQAAADWADQAGYRESRRAISKHTMVYPKQYILSCATVSLV